MVVGSPPREYWTKLPPADLIKAVGDGLIEITHRGYLEHALAKLADDIAEEDMFRLRRQLDSGTSLIEMMMRKRDHFGVTSRREDDS